MFELKPHQEEAVKKLANGRILCGGVGVGKSHTAVGYYLQNEAPKDVYVITTAKKRDKFDWQLLFADVGMTRDPETTQGSVVIVDSFNNIQKYAEVENAFFIFDEQRMVGSGAWVKAFLRIVRSNRWIMLSATPGDNWLDYVPVFIANGFVRNKTHFADDHIVWKAFRGFREVDHYRQVARLVKWRKELLVTMPYQRHTIRHAHDVECLYDKDLVDKVVRKKWHVYENRPLTNPAELFRVMRRVVYSNPSRLKAIESLAQKHPKLIVYYNYDFELEILRTLAQKNLWISSESSTLSSSKCSPLGNFSTSPISTVEESSKLLKTDSASGSFVVAEWNGHKHEEIPKTDRWVYLVQYVAGAEAWECIETDAMAFYSLPYSWKNFHQSHGRIDRLTTKFTHLHYYTLWADSFLERSIRRALKAKKSFNESAFSELTWGKS